MSADPITRALRAADDCVHCGLCLEQCPTYRTTLRESANPRGRIVLARALLKHDEAPSIEAQADLDLCLGCRACETVCPSGVAYGSILEAVRLKTRKRGFFRRLLMGLLTKKRSLQVALAFARLWQRGPSRSLRALLPKGLQRLEAMLPPLKASPKPKPHSASQDTRPQVQFFRGCLTPHLLPEIGQSVETLLQAAGFAVQSPNRQSCCGALHRHDGDLKTAKSQIAKNLRAFGSSEGPPILCDAAGCTAALKEADHLLPEATAFAQRTADALSFLRPHREALQFRSADGLRVAYAAPCHLHHAQKDHEGPKPLLAQIPNLQLVPLKDPDRCCGAAGLYNIDQPESSAAILDERLDALEDSAPDVLLSGNIGCLLQWQRGVEARGLKIQVLHPAVFLAAHLKPAPTALD